MWRNLGRWDSLAAFGLAALFVVLCVQSTEGLIDTTAVLGVAVALGVGISVGAAVAARWLTDATKGDSYGELLRAMDPAAHGMLTPPVMVALAGLGTSIGAGILLVIKAQLSRTELCWAYGLEVFLAAYAVFAMADLVLINLRHQARQSRMRGLEEKERRRRESN